MGARHAADPGRPNLMTWIDAKRRSVLEILAGMFLIVLCLSGMLVGFPSSNQPANRTVWVDRTREVVDRPLSVPTTPQPTTLGGRQWPIGS